MATTKIFFSDAERTAIQQEANGVWEDCAYDILEATAREKGKDINTITVSREVVMEIALDAGRTEQRLRMRANRQPELLTEDFFQRFERATYAELKALVKPVFNYARYGL